MTSNSVDAGTCAIASVSGFGSDRVAVERRLSEQGIFIPVTERAALLPALGYTDAVLVIAAKNENAPIVAANITVAPSRALPGHRRLRVTRFGASDSTAVDHEVLKWITRYAQQDSGCLGMSVEIFERNAARRTRLGEMLRALSYVPARRPRNYQKTLYLDLQPTEDELFGKLTGDTRRSIRAPLKKNLELRPVEDTALANRIRSMVRLTFSRTGGSAPRIPWEAIIETSRQHPELSRISGVFDPAVAGPDSLLSFAWGLMRGNYATYEAGATFRRRDLGSISLGYAPVWDIVQWARRMSASWFDFGGITPGSKPTADDPVGGISSFKRSFSDQVIEVGEEWVYEPHPVRSSLAHILAAATRFAMPRSWGAA